LLTWNVRDRDILVACADEDMERRRRLYACMHLMHTHA
jgi:hypothetical protein